MHFLENISVNSQQKLSRRNLLKLGIISAVTAAFPFNAAYAAARSLDHEKSVSLYNTHTGESLSAVYWSQGEYNQEALNDINYILRDFRAEKIRQINTELLDFLNAIRIRLGTRQHFHIVSGYRSPATNEFLRKRRKGVAKNSMHIYGKAVDFRVPKRDLSLVRKAAATLRYGGVGYYPYSDFVHIDVGKVRSW